MKIASMASMTLDELSLAFHTGVASAETLGDSMDCAEKAKR
ncbi:hypothetical protein [Neorhodopirellula lusitana]